MKITDNNKIFDKIKKCLALSKSSNQHEAQAALRQAQKLMEAHNISESVLLASSVGQTFIKARAKARPAEWETMLSALVAKAFGCDYYLVESYNCSYWNFVGVKPAPEIAEYTMQVLMRQILKERKTYMDGIHGNTSRAKKTARADLFCEGWVRSVRSTVQYLSRNKEQEAAIKAFTADYEIHEFSSKDRNEGKPMSHLDSAAYRAGSDKGKDVRLHHGVNGKEDQLRIDHVAT